MFLSRWVHRRRYCTIFYYMPNWDIDRALNNFDFLCLNVCNTVPMNCRSPEQKIVVSKKHCSPCSNKNQWNYHTLFFNNSNFEVCVSALIRKAGNDFVNDKYQSWFMYSVDTFPRHYFKACSNLKELPNGEIFYVKEKKRSILKLCFSVS